MAEVASAFVSLLPSAKGFGSKLDRQLGPEIDGAGKRTGKKFGTAMKIGAGAVLAGGAILAGFAKSSIAEAREAQKIGAITANVIRSTGGVAKVTTGQVEKLATAISNKTGIDDEAIQSASNLLLTFTNVRNEVGKNNKIFDQATQAATDMGAALGKDPKSAAIQLGKALNDPVKGITALSRVGVSFTEDQKQQIKTMVKSGNVLGAQKLILGELKKEFGGTAAAAATSGEKAQVAFGNLKESIGTALLPIVDKVATTFTDKVAPALQKFVAGIKDGTGAGGKFAATVKRISSVLVSIGKFLIAHKPILLAVVAAYTVWKLTMIAMAATQAVSLALLKLHTVGTVEHTVASKAAAAAAKIWAAGQWLLNAALSANPIGLIVIAIAALVVGFIYAYKHSEKFRAIIAKVGQVIVAAAGKVVEFVRSLKERFGDAVAFVKLVPGKIVGALAGLAATLGGKARDAFGAFLDAVKTGVGTAITFIAGLPGKVTGALVGMGVKLAGKARDAFGAFLDAEKRGIVKIVEWVTGIPGRILSGLGDLAGILFNAGKDVIKGFIEGIKASTPSLIDVLKGVSATVVKYKGPPKKDAKLLRPAGQLIMGGLIRGINEGEGDLRSTLSGITNRIQLTSPGLHPSVSGATTGGTGGGGQEIRGVMSLDRDGVATLRGVGHDAVVAGRRHREAVARANAIGAESFV